MRISLALTGIALLAAGHMTAGPATAAVETCQGKDATIVQDSGTVNGTAGDDVIVAGKEGLDHDPTTVLAGAGDDTVCVFGAGLDRFDGGRGVDSVELVGAFDGEGLPTVVDFEQLDVRTFFNLGAVTLEWTEVPAELSGKVDASYRGSAKVLDNPTVYLVAPEASEYGIRVDRRSEKVSLGEGLDFRLTGVDDIGMTAPKIRALGDSARNYFFLTGCDVVARGGDGNDRLWVTDKKVGRSCGARLYGQAGNDKMLGTNRNDVLIGGQGRDRADARGGRQDRCIAEKTSGCEL